MKLSNLTRPQNKGENLNLSTIWNKIDGVLFDFDGVFADSEPFYRKSWNTVLSDFNHSISEIDYWKHWAFYGEGLPGEIQRTGLQIANKEILKQQQRHLYESYCRDGIIPLFPYVSEIIKLTSTHKKCIIASNTNSTLIKIILGKDSSELLEIVGGEGLNIKPSPDIFLKAADYIAVKPKKCLVFEDAWKGVEAASRAGMPVVLVRNNYNRNFPAGNATLEIPDISYFYKFLRNLP